VLGPGRGGDGGRGLPVSAERGAGDARGLFTAFHQIQSNLILARGRAARGRTRSAAATGARKTGSAQTAAQGGARACGSKGRGACCVQRRLPATDGVHSTPARAPPAASPGAPRPSHSPSLVRDDARAHLPKNETQRSHTQRLVTSGHMHSRRTALPAQCGAAHCSSMSCTSAGSTYGK